MINVPYYEKVFLGKQFGISLSRRSPSDNHVLLTILSEDDGNWFVKGRGEEDSGSVEFSSHWIDDLKSVIEEAQNWLARNCEPDVADPSLGYAPGRTFGWKFKD
jgi:hypothetical protein